MARIYKESRYVLQLLIGKSYGAQYEDVKISFYTKNPNNQVMADDDITIKGNVAEVMVDSTLFDNLEEGLIKYIVYGTKDGIPFIEERQSNYFLKTPLDFKPTTCILEDKWVTPSMGDRDGNNLIVVEESEGYDGLSRVVIDPQTIYNEGVEAGRAEGGEGSNCNLEDKIVEPTVEDVEEGGWLYVYPSEGYNGMSRTTVGTSSLRNSWYNEGVEAGRAEGGEGSSCNLGVLDWTLDSPYGSQKNASDDGYDGYSIVVVRPENVINQEKEYAINDFKNKMKEISITENGTYSIDDREIRHYIEFDGNSYFDTNIPFGENTKIEVAILKTTYEEDEQIIGVAHYDLNVADTYGGFGIVVGAGLVYGVYGNAKTNNIPFSVEQEQILTLDRNGIHSSFNDNTGGWIDDSGLNNSSMYGTTIGIGKIKSNSDGWTYRGLNGKIRYVKIWTNKDDDSTMTLFLPKNMAQGGFGMVNSEGTEYNYVENLGEGTATFVEEWVNKYPKGFKRVEVNIPNTLENIQKQPISIDDYNALIGNYDPNVLYLIY